MRWNSTLVLGSFLFIFVVLLLLSVLNLWKEMDIHLQTTRWSPDCLQQHAQTPEPDHNSKIACKIGFAFHGGKKCIPCSPGTFSLANWITCQSLLNCGEIQHESVIGELLYTLDHWNYYRADWKGYEVLYATFSSVAPTTVDYDVVQLFPPSQYFLYPIGLCREKNVVLFAVNSTLLKPGSEYEALLKIHSECDNCMTRFHLARSYVHILTQLHATNNVLCNSVTSKHLLTQFLVSDNFDFILATLDNLPQDVNRSIICQQRELTGDFVAPEQRWPYGRMKIFNPNEQPKYDRMSDIWKVPNVVRSLLTASCTDVSNYLHFIHIKCKNMSPHKRPSALEILQEYEHVWKMLN